MFSLHFSSVAKVFLRENALFLDHESFCRKICQKKPHSRRKQQLIKPTACIINEKDAVFETL